MKSLQIRLCAAHGDTAWSIWAGHRQAAPICHLNRKENPATELGTAPKIFIFTPSIYKPPLREQKNLPLAGGEKDFTSSRPLVDEFMGGNYEGLMESRNQIQDPFLECNSTHGSPLEAKPQRGGYRSYQFIQTLSQQNGNVRFSLHGPICLRCSRGSFDSV